MNGVPASVTSRISMLEAQMASIEARVAPRRGGGRVGSGGAQASFAQAVAAATGPSQEITAAPFPGGRAPDVSTAGAWAQRLPSAGHAWATSIEAAAARNGVDPALLGALVWTESGFDPHAVSPVGARGLGQLMPGTAAELGVDPDQPTDNLDGAARYLRQQLDRFGDERLALAAYNAGPNRVAEAGGVPNITETTTYVRRVTERAAALRGTA